MYNWDSCAKFIANFLEYEELCPPNELPEVIPAPANVLEFKAGDCFDFSILLCSLLIGNGYDAFVVYGRAPKEITTRDESMLALPPIELPKLPSDEKEDIHPVKKQETDPKIIEDLKARIEEPSSSSWDEEERKKREEEARIRDAAEKEITDDEPEYQLPDMWKDRRLHCWVLIKRGKRDIKNSFYIEPSTGRKYDPKDSPYQSIEGIFNHRNFWVNMQPMIEVAKVDIENFDIKEDAAKEWEYVMLPTVHKRVYINIDVFYIESRDRRRRSRGRDY